MTKRFTTLEAFVAAVGILAPAATFVKTTTARALALNHEKMAK